MSNERQVPSRRFFTAPSQDRAVLEAAAYLDVDPEHVVYERVAARGLSRGKGVTIRVDHEATAATVAGSSAAEAPAPQHEPRRVAEAEPVEQRQEVAGEPPTEEASAPEELAEEASPAVVAPAAGGNVAAGQEDDDEAEASGGSPSASVAAESVASRPRVLADKVELPRSPVDLFSGDDAEADTEVTGSGQRWVDALLDLAELDLSVRVEERGDQVWFDLEGPDADLLLEDSGQILESVQHLLPRLMQSDLGRVVSCVADSNGFREFHLERLRVQAVSSAEAVRRQGRAVSLEPMNPPDRRAVHMALADDPAVETESSGRGYFKRITVRPA